MVILIPISKEHLDSHETISLQQCFRILKDYPIKLISPKNMNIDQYLKINPEASFDFIPACWLSNYMNLNILKVMPFLYKRYRKYDYILFYELDSFVLQDQLMEWCKKGFSYVSTQRLESWQTIKSNIPHIDVGSGGFSLRKTNDFLKALNSFSYIEKPIELWQRFKSASPVRKPYLFFDMIERLTIRNNTHPWFNDWIGIRQENQFWLRQDDVFWGEIINRNFRWFTVPDPLEAIQFGFDTCPQQLYELSGQRLPFGCHGWWKQGLEFWRPFVQSFGYKV